MCIRCVDDAHRVVHGSSHVQEWQPMACQNETAGMAQRHVPINTAFCKLVSNDTTSSDADKDFQAVSGILELFGDLRDTTPVTRIIVSNTFDRPFPCPILPLRLS